ncbi:MAG: type II secretion system F family protein [Candidatus Omnitrophica bacterium]|nr:type II secretion system F family protein [Candidatus Omnitrophota bacterium]
MEQVILLIVFISVFLTFHNIFMRWQKKYSQLEIRQLPQEIAPDLSIEVSRKEQKEGFKGILGSLSPLAQKFLSRKSKEGLVRDLVTAGKPLSVIEFYAFMLLSIIVCAFGGIILMNISKDKPIYIPVFAIFFGFYFPRMWLNGQIKKRQRAISNDLPSVIDLLNLCVGSGIDFMLAVHRVIKDYKRCPLTEELTILWQENNMGLPRKEALRNLSWRVNLPAMSSFVSTLIQADKMGTPISDALEIQAEQIRIRRFQQGEEQALKAPIKLLIPLIFFILPVVAVIVAAPILLQFLKGGIGF